MKQGDPLVKIASQNFGTLQFAMGGKRITASNSLVKLQGARSPFDEGVIAQRRVQENQAALADSEAALTRAKAAAEYGWSFSQAPLPALVKAKLEEALVLVAPKRVQ